MIIRLQYQKHCQRLAEAIALDSYRDLNQPASCNHLSPLSISSESVGASLDPEDVVHASAEAMQASAMACALSQEVKQSCELKSFSLSFVCNAKA